MKNEKTNSQLKRELESLLPYFAGPNVKRKESIREELEKRESGGYYMKNGQSTWTSGYER